MPDSFSKILELLAPLDDASIMAWARDFDWTMPVPVSHVVDGALVDTCISALDRLLETGNDRLIGLLLHSDMFRQDQRVSINGIRRQTTAWRASFTEGRLWCSAWFQAMSLGRVDLVRRVEQVAGAKLDLRVPVPDLFTVSLALHKAPHRSRPSLISYLLKDDSNALLRKLSGPGTLNGWPDDRHVKLAVELAKQTTELGMFNLIIETLPGKPPAMLLTHLLATESPQHKAMAQALSLLELADQRGGFHGQDRNGMVSLRDIHGNTTQWKTPMGLMIYRLAHTKMPNASFRKVASRLLAWPTASAMTPDPIALTQACARRCIQWDQGILSLVRAANPNPTPREMAWLILGATEEIYQARLADFLAATPSQAAWLQLAKHLDGSAAQHAQAASVGGKSSKNAHHTTGFPRLWERAASVVSSLPPEDRPCVDEAFRETIYSNHRDNPALAERMLSIYQTARLELSTVAPSASRARGPRL